MSFSYLREETGLRRGVFEQINVYIEQRENVDWSSPSIGAESMSAVCLVLYTEDEDDSCEMIVANNWSYPALHVHEIVEFSILDSGTAPVLLNDIRRKTGQGGWKEEYHYTRWFREGFADYAGFLAHQVTIASLRFDEDTYSLKVRQRDLDRIPFSGLDRVGKDLFTWHQYTNHPTRAESIRSHKCGEYYSAAFGLFLVIEDRFGRDAIKSIMLEVNQMERANGSDLMELTNRVSNTDVVKLVEGFRFPRTGLSMARPRAHTERVYPESGLEGICVISVEPDSAAARAGVRERDLLVGVSGKPVATNLYFELALYELMDEPSVTISLWRKGVGKLDVEMAIEYADGIQRSEDE